MIGFIYHHDDIFMYEVLTYSLAILGIKVYLKKKKYYYRSFETDINKRALQLINLHKKASKKDIQDLFIDFNIE